MVEPFISILDAADCSKPLQYGLIAEVVAEVVTYEENGVDADGVALAGVQALYRLLLEKEEQILQLTRRLEALERERSQ